MIWTLENDDSNSRTIQNSIYYFLPENLSHFSNPTYLPIDDKD